MRAFEDFHVGDTAEFGPMLVTAEAIKSFARQFDPQPMHLDEAAARNTIVGGLFASGLHTVCMHMRLLADGMLRDSMSMGSPRVEEVRYLAPVRPGDRLTLRLEVLEARPSESRPEMGIVRFRSHMVNADGQAVIRLTSTLLVGRRAAAAAKDRSGAP
jgi:acyl dehydratase